MEVKIAQHFENLIQIQGKNFHAFIELTEDNLSLDITEFKKGNLYNSQITNLQLEKQTRRFLIFKKVEELFVELRYNKRLQISDQNLLLIPVEIQYKDKTIELTIELPLAERKFTNEVEKMQNLFERIEKISEERQRIEKQNQKIIKQKENLQIIFTSTTQNINFKGDPTNQNYQSFKFFKNKNIYQIEMYQGVKDIIFNHFQLLPKQGIFSFKVKIVKTSNKHIFVGICGDHIKILSGSDAYHSPYYIGLYLANGNLYKDGRIENAIKQFKVSEGQIVEVIINMNNHSISWLLFKANKRCQTQITMELRNIDIHPMVHLFSKGDILEFLQ